jgi:aldose 1-epimerase
MLKIVNSLNYIEMISLKHGIAGLFFAFVIGFVLVSCNSQPEKVAKEVPAIHKGISQQDWGMADGKPVYLFTLTNQHGMSVKISNYGGTITSWSVSPADSDNNIVLGYDSLSGYLAKPPYFGATVGRYGNRIAKGQFTIGKNHYKLALNDGRNHLHGGIKGFDKAVWTVAPLTDSVPALTLSYLSSDGEEGYPGNLQVTVSFCLSDENALQIEYRATTDKATPVNLTNHSYFNLSGNVDKPILDHFLMIAADAYTPVDSTLIPTGILQPVKGTPFDFTSSTRIGARIDSVKGGYDHNWVLNRKDTSLQLAAVLRDTVSGRKLTVLTTEPGLQFYTGNFLNGKLINRDGKAIGKHAALCLETQHFPDSPNEPGFPSSILQPGQQYHSRTVYEFSSDR